MAERKYQWFVLPNTIRLVSMVIVSEIRPHIFILPYAQNDTCRTQYTKTAQKTTSLLAP